MSCRIHENEEDKTMENHVQVARGCPWYLQEIVQMPYGA